MAEAELANRVRVFTSQAHLRMLKQSRIKTLVFERRLRCAWAAIGVWLACSFGWAAAEEAPVEYNRDVRPILFETAFRAMGRIAPRGRPICGSTSARRPSSWRRSRPATRMRAR